MVNFSKFCNLFLPVTQSFWKRSEDVTNKVETRSQIQKYFLKISKTNISSM